MFSPGNPPPLVHGQFVLKDINHSTWHKNAGKNEILEYLFFFSFISLQDIDSTSFTYKIFCLIYKRLKNRQNNEFWARNRMHGRKKGDRAQEKSQENRPKRGQKYEKREARKQIKKQDNCEVWRGSTKT